MAKKPTTKRPTAKRPAAKAAKKKPTKKRTAVQRRDSILKTAQKQFDSVLRALAERDTTRTDGEWQMFTDGAASAYDLGNGLESGPPHNHETCGYPDDNPKTVMGLSKPDYWGVPPLALYVLGAAMANGVKKYGLFNWREKTVTTSVYINAMRRHIDAYVDGQNVAEDSAVHHLGHVMACCAILLDAADAGKLNDDRGHQGGMAHYLAKNTGSL
jgi:hypothetical protein